MATSMWKNQRNLPVLHKTFMKHSRKPPTIVPKKQPTLGMGKWPSSTSSWANVHNSKGDLCFFQWGKYGKIKCFGIALKFNLQIQGAKQCPCPGVFKGFFQWRVQIVTDTTMGSLYWNSVFFGITGRKWCDLQLLELLKLENQGKFCSTNVSLQRLSSRPRCVTSWAGGLILRSEAIPFFFPGLVTVR